MGKHASVGAQLGPVDLANMMTDADGISLLNMILCPMINSLSKIS